MRRDMRVMQMLLTERENILKLNFFNIKIKTNYCNRLYFQRNIWLDNISEFIYGTHLFYFDYGRKVILLKY